LILKVLVTGGAGFIGSHIVDTLLADDHQVLVVDDLSTGKESNLPKGVRLEKMDIGDPGLREVMLAFRPDAVSHLAAQISVPGSVANPWQDAVTNIVGGINVARAAAESTCPRFVYINTGGALYGVPDYLPCDEDHPIRPASPYGLSKWTLEQYLRLILPATIPLKVLRLANVYGPRQDPEGEAGVVAIFGGRMIREESLVIFGDGKQTRDYVYVGDVARAHRIVLEGQEPVTVNIGSGVGTSVNDLCQLMAKETEYSLLPEYGDPRPGDVEHVVLDVSRARRELGWVPHTTLEDGLRQTLASMALAD
jgi:UDP-glucose 4-epimerase